MVVAVGAGCTDELPTALPEPIAISRNGGAITTLTSVDNGTARVTLIDTGTPVTAYDDGSGHLTATAGNLQLLGAAPLSSDAGSSSVDAIERAQFNDVRLYTTPLYQVGRGSGFPIQAVLGGDNLQDFAVSFDYRGPTTMTLLENLFPCSCSLADSCQAVFPFTLAGGGQDRPIAIGDDVYTYPPSRVLIDVCLEPIEDPVSRNQPCTGQDPRCATTGAGDDPDCPPAAAYMPSGVEVKMLVATGFPGIGIGQGAFTRLRGASGLATALADSTALYDPSSPQPVAVGQALIGGGGLAGLAMVSREAYLGPCAELARSRRQRRSPPQMPRTGEHACVLRNACGNLSSPPDACDDSSQDSSTAAVIELEGPLPTLVLDDDSGLLASVNFDVRPSNATVEGVIGTDVLARLLTTVDYPNGRLVARCASDDGCLTYPRFTPKPGGCDQDSLCQSATVIPTLERPGGACWAGDPQLLPLNEDMGPFDQSFDNVD